MTVKFLLIKSTGNGFWYDMHHVLTMLYFSEITHRIPVVYWGKNCMYSIDGEKDAFSRFFHPVSPYSIEDLENPTFTYYPDVWRFDNLLEEYLAYNTRVSLDELIRSEADVVVQDTRLEQENFMCWVEKYPMYGYISRFLYSAMLKKYISLLPEISDEIEDYFLTTMQHEKLIAVHIRGSDKVVEVENLSELNSRYPCEINKILNQHPDARLFLMTDCSDIQKQYMDMYPGIIISTECRRVIQNGPGSHFQEYEDKARKGLEIIKDTWLAVKCDYFIGNGYSNVSMAISELKDWGRNRLILLY